MSTRCRLPAGVRPGAYARVRVLQFSSLFTSSASVDDADRPHIRRSRGAFTTDFDPDSALDHVELADVDPNAAHPRMLQEDRSDLFRERLDKIDMAAPHDQANGVENDVVGENRAHSIGVRAGATHESLDVEDDPLTDGTLEIIGADRGGNDEIIHEHTVEFASRVAPPNEPARQQSPINFGRNVGIGSLTRDEIADESDRDRIDRALPIAGTTKPPAESEDIRTHAQ